MFKSSFIFFLTSFGSLLAASSAQAGYTPADCTLALGSPKFNRGCSSVVITPGNDTKINLLLLNQDKLKKPLNDPFFPILNSRKGNHTFVWKDVKPPNITKEERNSSRSHTRRHCVSLKDGTRDFNRALSENNNIPKSEKDLLYQARDKLNCSKSFFYSKNWFEALDINSSQGSMFLSYVKAAGYFYDEDWRKATEQFSLISNSSDPWLREASLYMVARTELIRATDSAINKWGNFSGSDLVDKGRLSKAKKTMDTYLYSYPDGQYKSSAVGFLRRLMFLTGDYDSLGQEYARLSNGTDLSSFTGLRILEEIDKLRSKFSLTPGTDPIMLAVSDLARMRVDHHNQLSKKELTFQKAYFLNEPGLYSFLQATYAFYVEGDFKKVLTLISDGARKNSFSSLEFSRQVLRGMALATLNDKREEGFWKDFLDGVDNILQRPIVELGLTESYERRGSLNEIFKNDSLINDSYIRKMRLLQVASQDILREQAQNDTRPKMEKDLALFVLLYKELSRGRYDDFVVDSQIVPINSKKVGIYKGIWLKPEGNIPLGVFRDGTWSDGYPCPPISVTSAQLALDSQESKALLCLGDFYRLNGFDWLMNQGFFQNIYTPLTFNSRDGFPKKNIQRHEFYSNIIADLSAEAEDKAYALYRAIMCYSPAGYNSCGGRSVKKTQRTAWFKLLKGKYGKSSWAKELKYYW